MYSLHHFFLLFFLCLTISFDIIFVEGKRIRANRIFSADKNRKKRVYTEEENQLHMNKTMEMAENSRIYGGTEAPPELANFVARVSIVTKYLDSSTGNLIPKYHGCTGFVVARDKILSNAHCFASPKMVGEVVKSVHVWVGYTDVTEMTLDEALQVAYVDIHHKYNDNTNGHEKYADIAVITLDDWIEGRLVETIVGLPFKESVEGEEVFAAGFGRSEHFRNPYTLKWVKLFVQPQRVCTDYMTRSEITQKDAFLCLKGVNYTQGFCSGDSGGPLFKLNRVSKRMLVHGISSSRMGYCGYYDLLWGVNMYYWEDAISDVLYDDDYEDWDEVFSIEEE